MSGTPVRNQAIHEFRVFRRHDARNSPSEGVADEHERCAVETNQDRLDQFGVGPRAARRRRSGRRAESREVQGDRRDPLFGEQGGSTSEVLALASPSVQPYHAHGSLAVRRSENRSVAVGLQHVLKVTDSPWRLRPRHHLPVASW